MLNVTIEPAIFAPPFDAPTKDSVHGYVDRLLHWSMVAKTGRVRVKVAVSTADVLITAGYFPFRPWLKDLLLSTGTVEFDTNTIAAVAESLMTQSESLEEASQITDVLFENADMLPDIFADHTPQDVRLASERTAVIVALVKSVGDDEFAANNAMVVRDRRNSSTARISAMLLILEHQRADLRAVLNPPQEFAATLPICERFDDYAMSLDECALWRAARHPRDFATVISITMFKYRLRRGFAIEWEQLPQFRFDPEFCDSASRCGSLTNLPLSRALLRAIAETIDGQNLGATHWIREDDGANSPQVSRGADKAWRRDVDRDFHLHYWLCPGGIVELARVVHHDDVGI
jgi:hypothetical protein